MNIPFTYKYFRENYNSGTGFDRVFLLSVGILLLLGAVLVMSSSAAISYNRSGHTLSIFLNHSARVGIGILLMMCLAFLDYHRLQKLALPFLFFSIALLILVYFWPMRAGTHSHRWLYYGPISFQPAEIAKFALVLYLAHRLSRWRTDPLPGSEKIFFGGTLLMIAIVVGLVLFEYSVSMSGLILISSLVMLYLGGLPLKRLGLITLISTPVLATVAWFVPYTHQRLTGFCTGLMDPMFASFQVRQSIIGLGKGGWWGQGLGESTWASFRLPIPYKDFIFCILGEELGFAGCLGLLIIFSFFLWRGVKIARNAPDSFGYYLAFGALFTLTCGFFIHVGVSVGLLPPTGQPLPFISYGGSSLVMSLAAVGVLLNISRQGASAQAQSSRLPYL